MFPAEADIIAAAGRIAPYVHRTPVLTSGTLDEICSATLFFKCENLQKAGAFKSRGAMNAILQLSDEELQKGVATHSSGNHAQALARAARIMGVPAYIVMPETSPRVKVDAVRAYGGLITFCKPTLEARESTLDAIIQKTNATVVHPYNDLRIISGQATACKELLEQQPDLDVIVCPVGGGGLLSGTCLSARYFGKGCRVFAAEPSGADDAYRSMKEGRIIPSINPKTIADGLLTSLGTLTFPIIRDNVEQILRVDDEMIIRAMRLLWERAKLIVEPSGAIGLAAVMTCPEIFTGRRTGIVLSGGNVDLDRIPWLMR